MVVEIIIARLRQGPIFISEVGWMTRLVVWDHFSMRVQYAPLFLSSLSFSIFHIATTVSIVSLFLDLTFLPFIFLVIPFHVDSNIDCVIGSINAVASHLFIINGNKFPNTRNTVDRYLTWF